MILRTGRGGPNSRNISENIRKRLEYAVSMLKTTPNQNILIKTILDHIRK